MYASAIEFVVPDGTDWEAMRAMARERARTYYVGLPGLRDKAFIIDPERSIYGGLYVWETRQALDAFLQSDVLAGITRKFGQPHVRVYEVTALVERGEVVDTAGTGSSG